MYLTLISSYQFASTKSPMFWFDSAPALNYPMERSWPGSCKSTASILQRGPPLGCLLLQHGAQGLRSMVLLHCSSPRHVSTVHLRRQPLHLHAPSTPSLLLYLIPPQAGSSSAHTGAVQLFRRDQLLLALRECQTLSVKMPKRPCLGQWIIH